MMICKFGNCTNEVKSIKGGLCSTHYQQKRLGKELREIKPHHKTKPGDICTIENCKGIVDARGMCNSHYRRSLKYTLSWEQVNELEKITHCEICGEPREDKPLHVDHNNQCCPVAYGSCGSCVRGMLCQNCNHGLGKFQDNVEYLEKAIEYLKTRSL